MMRYHNKGYALTVVVVMIIFLSGLATWSLQLGYNQNLLAREIITGRSQAYYYAKAGMWDALEYIRKNPATFEPAAYDHAAYNIDVDGDADDDVTVDIGVRGAGGFRIIECTSISS